MSKVKCPNCSSTEFKVLCYELTEQFYDGESESWGNTETAEEAYFVSAECNNCGKDITAEFREAKIPGLMSIEQLREAVKS